MYGVGEVWRRVTLCLLQNKQSIWSQIIYVHTCTILDLYCIEWPTGFPSKVTAWMGKKTSQVAFAPVSSVQSHVLTLQKSDIFCLVCYFLSLIKEKQHSGQGDRFTIHSALARRSCCTSCCHRDVVSVDPKAVKWEAGTSSDLTGQKHSWLWQLTAPESSRAFARVPTSSARREGRVLHSILTSLEAEADGRLAGTLPWCD